MIDRKRVPWVIALIALAVLPAAAAVWMTWYSAILQHEVNRFYNDLSGTEVIPDEVYRRWDALQQHAYALFQLATPVMTGALVAAFALLAVLARRWDVTRGRALPAEATRQTGASAAS